MAKPAGWTFRIAAGLLAVSLGACASETVIGVRDSQLAQRIDRLNATQGAYERQEHSEAERLMLAELKAAASASEKQHLLNELADLYSYHLLDIERAIEADGQIQAIGVLAAESGFKSNSANNRILKDTAYRDRYVNVSSGQIVAGSRERMARNRSLLSGSSPTAGRIRSRSEMEDFLAAVNADLLQTYPGTADRRQVISRLIRAEWELINLGAPPRALAGADLARKEGMKPTDFFFQEIDFLSLSRYYEAVFDRTGDLEAEEMALAVVYIPYSNITDYASRWSYNRLVNRHIDKLIETCHKAQRLHDMLYYISLNKSRMILEERARYSAQSPRLAGGSQVVAIDPVTHLPDKQAFLSRARSAPAFLDYYIAGDYQPAPARSPLALASRRDSAGSLMELRAVAVAAKPTASAVPQPARPAADGDVFVEGALYITYLERGAIQARRLSGSQIGALRASIDEEIAGLEAEYLSLDPSRAVAVAAGPAPASPAAAPLASASPSAGRRRPAAGAAAKLLLPFPVAAGTVVSPDKWLSKYPFALAMGTDAPRALNLMGFAPQSRLSTASVLGLFNPTGDLLDSELEIPHISRNFPDSQLLARAAASKGAFGAAGGRSILHLSMHGLYNPDDPSASKLLFAGSRIDDSSNDAAALYARDMLSFPAAQGNELVFLAACETGLTANDNRNSAELLGILRPLLIGNNKNIVLTLWKVNSMTAGKFVEYFYDALGKSRDVRQAFASSQERLRAEYPDSPYIWAPYYLIQ
ncbi:CHAT domain-containing protein [Azospirillum agricola]|uniref:CHAT domain-containing protein n=1 Tax=Azospirillum agricola TaxID=1720247 RepID=UPI000A0F1A5E|nr:CHAT domain-containing protein [Azospirillum agricola]SMH47934.1 CHAT domain-containing protein [Azospirillum lipoferum]